MYIYASMSEKPIGTHRPATATDNLMLVSYPNCRYRAPGKKLKWLLLIWEHTGLKGRENSDISGSI